MSFDKHLPFSMRKSPRSLCVSSGHSLRPLSFSSRGVSHQDQSLCVTVNRLPSMEMKVLVAQSCPTVCDPMDCSPPGSPVYGIGVSSHSLLQGIFLIQGLNPGVP